MGQEQEWTKSQLKQMVDSLLWQYRLIDAFWFINVEKQYGLDSAEDLNAKVWGKVGELAARDILKRFCIAEKGLKGFAQAMEYYPWKMMQSFEIDEHEDELIVWSSECPAQMGRLRHGLGEYSCKEMHKMEFEAFARVIDSRIKVECLFAPPDEHPKDMFCKWRIYLSDE